MLRMLAALILVPILAMADEAVRFIKAGDPWPTLNLHDQHDKPMVVGADTRAIVFTADKTAGDMLNALLKERSPEFMGQRGLVYIADISRMPGLITSMIALPKMREYPYRMAVVREEGQTAMLPRAENSVTLILLEGGKVKELRMFKENEAQQLAALLDALPDFGTSASAERKGSRLPSPAAVDGAPAAAPR